MSEVQELMQRMGYKTLPVSENPQVNEAANKGRACDQLHNAPRDRVQELEAACAKVLDAYLRVDQPAHDGEADLCSAVLDMREILKCAPSAAPVD